MCLHDRGVLQFNRVVCFYVFVLKAKRAKGSPSWPVKATGQWESVNVFWRSGSEGSLWDFFYLHTFISACFFWFFHPSLRTSLSQHTVLSQPHYILFQDWPFNYYHSYKCQWDFKCDFLTSGKQPKHSGFTAVLYRLYTSNSNRSLKFKYVHFFSTFEEI